MTKDQKDKWIQTIQSAAQPAVVQLSDKEQELLGKLLTSAVMIHSLTWINAYAMKASESLLSLHLEDSQQREQATRVQGYVSGLINAMDLLFGLAVIDEEEQDQEEGS